MRALAILSACALLGFSALPMAALAQQSSTTTTTISQPDLDSLWKKIEGSWMQTRGAIKEQWGKLTEDDLMEIQGRREKLVGKIQTRYGIGRDQAEAQVSGWEHHYQSM